MHSLEAGHYSVLLHRVEALVEKRQIVLRTKVLPQRTAQRFR